MPLTDIDPTTYSVPTDQALLYSQGSGSETVYKYKLSSGSIGDISKGILSALDVKPADFPCLIYSADLFRCLNENFVSVGNMTIALAAKASTAYVKQVVASKVSKNDFLSTVATMPTNAEMNAALSLKANAEEVSVCLAAKADAASVYSVEETQGLFESFIGAETVGTFDELNALEPGIRIFVWVSDPTGDASLTEEQKTGPVLYMWKKVDGVAKYVFQATASGGFSSGVSADVMALLGDGFSTTNTVTAKVGNINSSLTSVTSNVNNLTGRLVTVEGSAHRHHADNNYTYVNRPYGCSDSVEAYRMFTQMSMPAGEDDIDKFIAKYYYAAMICNGNIYYTLSAASNFNGVFYSYSTGTTVELSQATDITICGNVIAAVQAGNLYVRGLKQLTNIQRGGNLLGTSTLTTDDTNWTKVGTDTDWKSLDALWYQWLMIKTSGKLYTAGHNVCGLQATAAFDSNNNPIFNSVIPSDTVNVFGGSPYLVASPTEVKLMEGGSLVSKTDWLDAKAGAFYSMARRGKNGKGSLYLWGCNHCGQIGDGVKYVIDMKVCYAWVNGTTTLYTVSATPKAGDALYSDITVSTIVGTITSVTASSLISSNAVTYTRTASSDVYPYKIGQTTPKILSLENGTVYSDWEDYSAGWYHAVALRHDVSGNSEVYVWGSNEYGQLGNGNYCNASLMTSTLPQGVNNSVELIAWPHKLTSAEFPYTDAVSVKATHYGTFITRANGDVFFAGCNKRNQLGIGNVSKDTTFIPTFTKLGSLFSSGTVYAETYGSFLIRAVPQLTKNADIAVQATLADDFSPEKLSDAMIAAHSHSVAVGIIDDAALMIQQYTADIPTTVAYKHKHSNLSSLNKLTVNNGLLYISGELYSAGNGGSGSGTAIMVDASNKQLDSLTDVVGLCNTAGGMPFEVMTYYPKSDTVTYVHLTPLGTQFHAYDRFLPVYKKSGTTYSEISDFSVDIQRCGIYAIMSNATTAVPNRIIKCTKDLIDCVTHVLKSSTATLKLCYMDTSDAGYDAANPIATLTYATLKSYQDSLGNLYWRVGESSEYRSVDSMPSYSTSLRSLEDEKWFTVYNAEHEVVYSEDDFKANTLYFSDGTVVSNTASITFPSSHDSDNNPVYRAIYTTPDASGDPVIGLTALQSGLYKKEGTSYLKIQKYDAPEEFNEDIFEDGTIYINPSKNSYVGLANQQYTFSAVKFIYSSMANSDGIYPLESVILQLDSKISNQDDSDSDIFEAGSVSNPILAALPSKYRAYASSATGEYNASIGYDSVSTGNSNQVFGDYSLGSGLANIVVGSMSAAFGNNNTVTSDSSFVLGGSNSVNGFENYAVGISNFMYGYYSVTVGCMNVTTGVDAIAVGFSNEVFANRAIAVGNRNKIIEKAEDAIVNGLNNEVYATRCYVQGMNGRILRMEGNNPGEDTSVLCTITANDYAAANYDISGIANKNGMFWTMGDGLTENIGEPLIVLAYTKYVWHRNAAYFNTTATSTARASIEPYLYEPLHQWKFTGMISQRFTISSLKSGSTTEYTSTYREGGRVKSFDAGLEFTSTGAVTLNAYHAQRFKLKGTGASVIPYLCNFKDGDEFSVVVYAGVIVSWTGFTSNSNQTEGSNSFGALIWKEGSAPRAVNTYSLGFQLIRFTVVDTVCIGELVADTVA